MDAAYNQQALNTRRATRSSTNLNHLSLAPLTSKLPYTDRDTLPSPITLTSGYNHHVSYLEGRSAPTTPSVLSRSNSRVSIRKATKSAVGIPKSKSSSALQQVVPTRKPGTTTPGRRAAKDGLTISTVRSPDLSESDWLLRAGALLSSEARDSKGQGWLVSRASSTSLFAHMDEDEEAFQAELGRQYKTTSRNGSTTTGDADDEFSPFTTRISIGNGSRQVSHATSRVASRAQSRRGSKAGTMTPFESTIETEGYFNPNEPDEDIAEPDFIDIDEYVHADNDIEEDEIFLKRLARQNGFGLGGWVNTLMNWSLFSVDEDPNETEDDLRNSRSSASEQYSRNHSASPVSRQLQRVSAGAEDDEVAIPPPGAGQSGWQDAAWLLSVATKVFL